MVNKIKKIRVDELLVKRGLCDSRNMAKTLILGAKVFSGTQKIDKSSRTLPIEAPLSVKQPPKYVSRGGEKLEGFLKEFPFEIANKNALDVGASTGGFTDCLLQNGAAHVTCIDVGRAQIHNKIAQDKRIENFEKLNARQLDDYSLPHTNYPIIVMDLSFISLTKVFRPVWNRLSSGGTLVALIKPQFEASKKEVNESKGIIKDVQIQNRILDEIKRFIESNLDQASILGCKPSVIKGMDGNQEYLIGVNRNEPTRR
jgi:23S rRNA (cytidine1920-2'-O)/16S rRNA (cytidine1409-2'-O)-methyltransferase